MNPSSLARARLLGAALLFSTGGAAIKACSLTAWQVAAGRSGLAFLALLVMLPAARRGWGWRTALVGSAYAATMILYVIGNKLTTAANTIFLQSTAPLYVLLASPLLLGERSRRRDIALMGALALGMMLFFVGHEEPLATAPDPVRGNLAALGAGVCWGLTLLGLRWLGREGHTSNESGASAVAAGNLIAFAVGLPFIGSLPSLGAADLAVLVYLGVFQIGLAYVFLTAAMRHLRALEASLLLIVEPVLNPVWAWLIQGEVPDLWSAAGGVIIVASITIHALVRPTPRANPS